jgi:hypothetical protein
MAGTLTQKGEGRGATVGRQLVDSPLVPPMVAMVVATAFVLLRWQHAAQHHLSAFVVAGSKYVSSARLPKGFVVHVGSGYDGQFYYRLAVNPFNLARTSYGIHLDSMSRVERMGYPFLAWALSGGHQGSVPLTLVIVNIVAAGVLALAGGLLARSAGHRAAWGLLFPMYWGYLWTLGRDLSELTTAAFVMLGLAALVRRHEVWAGLAFLGAIVSKETAVLLVGTLALTTLWIRWRDGRAGVPSNSQGSTRVALRQSSLALQRSDLAYVIPAVGFVAWQLILFHSTKKLPIFESGGENLGVPLVGLAHGVVHYLSAFPSVASALWIAELGLIIMLVAGAVRLRHQAPQEFRVLWIVSAILGLSAATGIWLGDVGFRSLDDIYLTTWVVLLFQRQRLWPWAALCGIVWVVVAGELIRYI